MARIASTLLLFTRQNRLVGISAVVFGHTFGRIGEGLHNVDAADLFANQTQILKPWQFIIQQYAS
jgi:hypothetical protein